MDRQMDATKSISLLCITIYDTYLTDHTLYLQQVGYGSGCPDLMPSSDLLFSFTPVQAKLEEMNIAPT